MGKGSGRRPEDREKFDEGYSKVDWKDDAKKEQERILRRAREEFGIGKPADAPTE